jgi:hypothetical protein
VAVDTGQAVLVLVIYVLAVARLTRLINADTILDTPRVAIAARSRNDDASLPERRRWQTAFYFVQCPWCVGMWLTFGLAWVPLYHHGNPVAQYIGVALAASHLIGVFAFAADTEEMDMQEADE